YRDFAGKGFAEALVALPLVLPPTVFGYYLLVAFGAASPIGRFWEAAVGGQLVFTFEGLLLASIVFNLPFAIQPMQRGFEAIPAEVRAAAACCGLSPWRALLKVELPLAWPGVLTAMVLSFAHTLGEFGIVLMVGGSIPGETRTVAIAIYDRVQAFDDAGAGRMSALLLVISLTTIALTYAFSRRLGRRLG
ncbi:MAG: molybdate ABC transporter permease subunit, partial [Tistlia sp.]